MLPGLLVEGPSLHSGLSCTTTENGPWRSRRRGSHWGGGWRWKEQQGGLSCLGADSLQLRLGEGEQACWLGSAPSRGGQARLPCLCLGPCLAPAHTLLTPPCHLALPKTLRVCRAGQGCSPSCREHRPGFWPGPQPPCVPPYGHWPSNKDRGDYCEANQCTYQEAQTLEENVKRTFKKKQKYSQIKCHFKVGLARVWMFLKWRFIVGLPVP